MNSVQFISIVNSVHFISDNVVNFDHFMLLSGVHTHQSYDETDKDIDIMETWETRVSIYLPCNGVIIGKKYEIHYGIPRG